MLFDDPGSPDPDLHKNLLYVKNYEGDFEHLALNFVAVSLQTTRFRAYLPESVFTVGLQESIPAQIRQLILDISNNKDNLTDLCGN